MSSDIRSDTVLKRIEPLTVEQQGEGFYAVLAVASGRVLITNETGRRVLDLCDGRRTADEIGRSLAEQFPSHGVDVIERDVRDFLDQAVEKGALTW